jgi:hypothetical protein
MRFAALPAQRDDAPIDWQEVLMSLRQYVGCIVMALAAINAVAGESSTAQNDSSWLPDASQAKFPDRPASGQIGGQPFKPDVVRVFPFGETSGKVGDPPAKQDKVDGVMLKLRQGEKPADAPAITVFCVTKRGETVDGKTFVLGPGGVFKQTDKILDKDGKGWFDPVAGVQITKQTADGKPTTDLFPKATMRLTFGKRKDGRLPGQIYLCIDDGQKTYVAGAFDADIKDDKVK